MRTVGWRPGCRIAAGPPSIPRRPIRMRTAAFAAWTRLSFYADAVDVFWQDWVLNYNLERQLQLASRVGESGRHIGLNWSEGPRFWSGRNWSDAAGFCQSLRVRAVRRAGAGVARQVPAARRMALVDHAAAHAQGAARRRAGLRCHAALSTHAEGAAAPRHRKTRLADALRICARACRSRSFRCWWRISPAPTTSCALAETRKLPDGSSYCWSDWKPRPSAPCGARTLACRVETHLDACLGSSPGVDTIVDAARTSTSACATSVCSQRDIDHQRTDRGPQRLCNRWLCGAVHSSSRYARQSIAA